MSNKDFSVKYQCKICKRKFFKDNILIALLTEHWLLPEEGMKIYLCNRCHKKESIKKDIVITILDRII